MVKIDPMSRLPEFANQREDELVVMVLFKHWWLLAGPVLKALLIIAVSLLIPIWFHFMGAIFRYGIIAAAYYLWHVFWIGYMVYQYLTWYLDKYIITNQRIIDIDQQGLFRRKVSEVELSRIQNITHLIAGIIPTMLNFGTVVIQSAGANDLTLDAVANPPMIQEEVAGLVKEATADQPVTAADLIKMIKDAG